MLTGIDHLVIAVADPDAAAATLTRDLGLAFTGGGRHEGAGTFNRLAFLGDSYVELIGVFDRALVLSNTAFAVGRATLAQLDERGEGLATWAVATDDIAADWARLRASGSPIAAPVAGSRTRPDGVLVSWLTAFPALGPSLPPFLIEHLPDPAEWGPGPRANRAQFRHPVGGAVRLGSVSIPLADPATWSATLGLAFTPEGVATIGSQLVTLQPTGGIPEVHLHPEPAVDGTMATASPLDLVRFGVRWRYASRHGRRTRLHA